MPFKSQAQRRKFAELLVQGKISPKTFEEWNRETGDRKLPERVKSAEKQKPVRAKKKTTRKAKVSEDKPSRPSNCQTCRKSEHTAPNPPQNPCTAAGHAAGFLWVETTAPPVALLPLWSPRTFPEDDRPADRGSRNVVIQVIIR